MIYSRDCIEDGRGGDQRAPPCASKPRHVRAAMRVSLHLHALPRATYIFLDRIKGQKKDQNV